MKLQPPNPNNPRPSKIQLVEQTLAAARPWGLEAEVVWSALNATVEANPTERRSFEDALEYALSEWDIDTERDKEVSWGKGKKKGE
jgi:hypothetical protein